MADQQLDAVFGALADPTRRAILARLKEGEASVAELAAPFAMSQPAVSRHLKVLETAGLISRSRKATVRLSHLRAAPLRAAAEWLVQTFDGPVLFLLSPYAGYVNGVLLTVDGGQTLVL